MNRHNLFSTCPGVDEEYIHWLPIMAAARLSENLPVLERSLVMPMGKA